MAHRSLSHCGALLLSLYVVACSDDARHAAGPAPTAGTDGSGSLGGSGSHAGGGSHAGSGAAALGGEAGAGGQEAGSGGLIDAGGGGGGSDAGTPSTAGGATPEPDPIPPVGDPPVCAHGLAFQAGSRLAISQPGDDLLQAVTPDELTIAWRNGDRFFVADRGDVGVPFGTPLEVAGGSEYVAVTLSPDGLRLIGVKTDLSVAEQTRGAGMAFADPNPGVGDFQSFNATLSSIPLGDQFLTDLVMTADEASLFFSHYTGDVGNVTTVFESHRSGSAWQFVSADLGSLLRASGQKRRAPTGVSSDKLTLFYRDDVKGDFRAAWRVNIDVPFDYAEVLTLGTNPRAVGPNRACSRVYYSADGEQGVDLFVAPATP